MAMATICNSAQSDHVKRTAHIQSRHEPPRFQNASCRFLHPSLASVLLARLLSYSYSPSNKSRSNRIPNLGTRKCRVHGTLGTRVMKMWGSQPRHATPLPLPEGRGTPGTTTPPSDLFPTDAALALLPPCRYISNETINVTEAASCLASSVYLLTRQTVSRTKKVLG